MKDINNKTQVHTRKSKKVRTGPFCFWLWIFKVEVIIIVTYFTLNFISDVIPDKTKFIIKYNFENILCKDIDSKEYTIEEIFQALNENKNLSIEEKVFIKENLNSEIIENIEYIDSSEIAKRFKKLNTSYYKKYEYNENINQYELQNIDIYLKKIGGNYNSFFNEINIYEQTNDKITDNYKNEIFNFETCDKRIYFHELNHLMTKNTVFTMIYALTKDLEKGRENKDFFDTTKITDKEIFLETINEVFTLEYMPNTNEYSYNEDMIYAYALIEILPEDVIRKYKFYDNQSILISGLLEIDDNIDKVYELLYSINKVCEKKGTKNDYKNIHDGFAYFYEKKYNKNISEDLEIQLYFYGTDIQTNTERTFIRNVLELEGDDEILKLIPKGYFSEAYKKEHSKVYIEYFKDGDIKISNV